MGKRVFKEDITTLALLYNYEASKSYSRMLPQSMINEFDKVIDINLDEMDSTMSVVYPLDSTKLIYTNTQDEDGNWYSVIKSSCTDTDLDRVINIFREDEYFVLMEASKKANALETLGIQLKDGKMERIEKKKENSKLKLDEIIERAIMNPYKFYKEIASVLSPQEKEFLKKQLEWKCCLNCTNPSCRIESCEKTKDSCCVAWENGELIGRQLILKNSNE